MKKRIFTITGKILAITALAVFITACGNGDGKKSDKDKKDEQKKDEKDGTETTLLEVDGQLFSIPSPIQTAILLKKVGTEYNGEILNSPKNVMEYSTNFKKAANLGIYGADLGYVTMYDQTQVAITYLNSVKKLADDLGVTSAFDMELVERFEKNIGNKDSLFVLISDAYRVSDAYLKSNERKDVGGLVLAGGWVESLYFATEVAKQNPNKEVIKRIGEQKTTLNNLIKLLTPFYSKPQFQEFIDKLMELNEIYEEVSYTYTYEKPTTKPEEKLTVINSKTKVEVPDDVLKKINEKVQEIRTFIIS